MQPLISVIIPNFNHPHLITISTGTLATQEGVPFEVVVVDNGSQPETIAVLYKLKEEGKIDRLVLLEKNTFFSGANNAGFRASNPESEYILLMNSDVAIRRPGLLSKMVEWMNGVPEYKPDIWADHPTIPRNERRDIVSVGWSWDANLKGNARPEGFFCMIRRSAWVDMSMDMPHHNGFEEAIAKSIRAGAKAGVLSQYGNWMIHRECGSGKQSVPNSRAPEMAKWFAGLEVETLDFSLGDQEHSSYLIW